ncbi:MAG: sigma-54 dependent transcriptional regulator [Planctomycetota bacterium]
MPDEPQQKARVLIIDDDRIILDSLAELLQNAKYEVLTLTSFAAALQTMERQPADIVLTDVNMPGGNGFELLHALRKRFPDTSVIMMTGFGTIESAVEAIKMGAFDYLTKPINDDELILCIDRALAQLAIIRENRSLKEQLDERFGLSGIVGHDYRMQKVFDLMESVANSKVNVLVLGASGTGKSLLARVIHQRSPRRDKPFVEVSCGAIPEPLLESELFGHARGAFTGAVANKVGKFKAAHGGTIFLDEIATASPALQVKLLRVLQSHQFEPVGSNKTETVDVRIILATNVDLETEVKSGRFREDLYYRVNVISIELPNLCERISDIPLLAKHFLQRFAKEAGRVLLEFDDEALHALQRYSWPGNVRELENVVERAVVLSKGHRVTLNELPPKMLESVQSTTIESCDPAETLREALEEPERHIIESALRANGWNRQATAAQLGINRTTLYKKMRRFGLLSEPAIAS